MFSFFIQFKKPPEKLKSVILRDQLPPRDFTQVKVWLFMIFKKSPEKLKNVIFGIQFFIKFKKSPEKLKSVILR